MEPSFKQPVSSLLFVTASMLPCFIFIIVSIPVKRRSIIQEVTMFILWILGLCVPMYFAGELSYVSQMSTSVLSWATSMKMGVWLFCMTMEERRLCPFALTILSWRKKRVEKEAIVERDTNDTSATNVSISLAPFVLGKIKHILISDASEAVLHICDTKVPIQFFTTIVFKSFGFLGLSTTETGFSLSFINFVRSTAICMVFAVYLQMQLELTYDVCMIIFALMHKAASILEKWKQKNYSKQKDVAKTKDQLRHIETLKAVKIYLEEIINMPPAFDSPWSAHSLRDFWGRRWHTYYNDCFYRLGYQPIRLVVRVVSGYEAPRWLPALSVFVMSGLMHEYFLYVSTGPESYFSGTPLPRGFIQFSFFVSQIFFISIGDKYFRSGRLGKIHAFGSMIITCHLFVVPYLMNDYLDMPRLSFSRTMINTYRGNMNILDPIY